MLFYIGLAIVFLFDLAVFIGLVIWGFNNGDWVLPGTLIAIHLLLSCLILSGTVWYGFSHDYFGTSAENVPVSSIPATSDEGPTQPDASDLTVPESDTLDAPSGMPSDVKIYGDRIINVCDPNMPKDGYPEMQIEILWTDGIKRPESVTGLDLNRAEVGEGFYYLTYYPYGSGGHSFDADGHFTYEVHGGENGTYVLSTAFTAWCNYDETNDWDTETEMRPGMVQFHPVDGDICAASAWKWVGMPSNGKLPKPNCSGSATSPEASVNTNESVTSDLASCEMPSGDVWTWEGNYWKYDSTTGNTFVVPEWIVKADWYNGTTDISGSSKSGEKVVNANTISAFCK